METSKEPLVVVVSGGGPVGLTFSLTLVALMGENVRIQIYEGRWFVDEGGQILWQGGAQGKTRRDQVVTLQDHVIEQLPQYVQEGLFSRINERVWPTSRNIPIREVEDRLFDLIQPYVSEGIVELIPENLDENSECLTKGTYDILVGADGASSFVRRYCNIQMISEGLEYACGVAYNIPDKVSEIDEPLHQALNCVLTVSQTRYLVNSSTSRRGYLNIRLVKDEYDSLSHDLESFQAKKKTLDLSDYSVVPQSPVWLIIRQGLTFFKIPSKYVFRVVPIEINVRHASIVVRELRFEIKNESEKTSQQKQYKTMLAFLIGDAAMTVHFWPGRGMNSGMKAALSLARNIYRTCTPDGRIQIQRPLRFNDFIDYEGFMAKLRAREQQGRSLRILVNPIDPYIEAGYSFAHLNNCYKKYSGDLIEKLTQTTKQLESRAEWPHKTKAIDIHELKAATKRIDPTAVAQLSLANPWPTREMSGSEVLVQQTFPLELSTYQPPPPVRAVQRVVDHRFTRRRAIRTIILWITGDKIIPNVTQLIDEVRTSKLFRKSSKPDAPSYQMITLEKTSDLTSWIEINTDTLKQPDVFLKIVTAWNISHKKTAVDVIKIIRSILACAPILIFTSALHETTAALEYPNVTATEKNFELKEFIGTNQEGLWGPGFTVGSVTPSDTDSKPKAETPKPLLVWFDKEDNDPNLIKVLREKLSKIEMKFTNNFQNGKSYIEENLTSLRDRNALTLFITRGFFRSEMKSCQDIIDLLESSRLLYGTTVVYTRDPEDIQKRYPNTPRNVRILSKRQDVEKAILDFFKKSA